MSILVGNIIPNSPKPLKWQQDYEYHRNITTINRGVELRSDGKSTISSGIRPLTEVYYGGRDRESKDKLFQQLPDYWRIECQCIPIVKNNLHIIWCTYERQRLLYADLRIQLFEHIVKKLAELGIKSERLNIQPEHVHLLMELPSDKCIADVVRQLKGESSNWINDNNLIRGKFRWSRGFAAFSISASQLDRVKHYISNQDEHHRSRSFMDEYKEFVEKYGFTYDDK